VRSIKDECLNKMIFIGQASLRRALCEYIEHYHEERNHQGLGNRLIRLQKSAASDGCVHRRERLGGTLTFITGTQRNPACRVSVHYAILCLGEAADADQPRLRSPLALMDGSRDRPARLELLTP
jgi:hypothetical protein